MSNRRLNLWLELLAPLAIATVVILMEKPATRQALTMRAALTLKHFAQWQSDFWGTVARHAGTTYNRARL